MQVYETLLNGKRLCVAGIDDDGVVTIIIDSVRRNARAELQLTVAGLVSATGEHVTWTRTELQVGDDVQVKVRESASADEPGERERRDPASDLEQQRTYVRRMAKKLGWQLVERHN